MSDNLKSGQIWRYRESSGSAYDRIVVIINVEHDNQHAHDFGHETCCMCMTWWLTAELQENCGTGAQIHAWYWPADNWELVYDV